MRNEGGNLAVITGLTVAPVFFSIGLSVECTELSRRESDMQNALDAAVFATTREFSSIRENKIGIDHLGS